MIAYRYDLTPDDNDTVLITSPDFPELASFAETEADAERHALAAVEEALAARISANEPLPVPHRGAETGRHVRVSLLITLKAMLYALMVARGVTRAELARMLGWHREQVDRLFRLDHQSHVAQLDAAFHALGGTLGIELDERSAA